MTTDHDPRSRTVVAWLREDQHESAERVLLAALNEIDHTHQRRSWWPARRFAPLNSYTKVLVSAAAVVALAVVGITLLPLGAGTGGPPANASPIVEATATPSATPSPTTAPLPSAGLVEPGTYVMTDGTSTFTVTVPAGWNTDGTDLRKDRDTPRELTFQLYPSTIRVYPDACATEDDPPLTGPTASDLIDALQAQQHSDVGEPAALTIGGRPATRVEVSVPAGLDTTGCTIGVLRIWTSTVQGSYLAGLGAAGRTPVYIVDGPSGRVVFTVDDQSGATAADKAELQGIVDSITFDAP